LEVSVKNLRQLLQNEKTKTDRMLQKEQDKTEEYKMKIDAIVNSHESDKQNLLAQLSKEVNEKCKIQAELDEGNKIIEKLKFEFKTAIFKKLGFNAQDNNSN